MDEKKIAGDEKADAILKERAKSLATPLPQHSVEPQNVESYVLFSIGDITYGLSSKFIKLTMQATKIIEIIRAPKHIRGLVRVEGRTIPMVYLPYFWHPESDVVSDTDYLILVSVNGTKFALMANLIEKVVKIPISDISAPPATLDMKIRSTLRGITKDGTLLIDAEYLIESDGFAVMSREEIES